MKKSIGNTFSGIFRFYFEGFRNMSSWGKKAWIIILIKLFIMFAILKFFFFPDFLKVNFKSDQDRGNYVRENLTEQNHNL
jgi:hypothetical protein